MTALEWLTDVSKRIRVFPERDFRCMRAEILVIDTLPMQRLRLVKQLGLSYLVFPTAEHTRFTHSLGTAYWTAKFLHSLQVNASANENKRRLIALGELLGAEYNVELLARLYGLLHDVTHLPFGHTLEDQLGLCPRHDADAPRIDFCFDTIKKDVRQQIAETEPHAPPRTYECLEAHLDMVRRIYEIDRLLHKETKIDFKAPLADVERWLPTLMFLHDMVSNTMCADLVDYTLRDTLFSSLPRGFDKVILDFIEVLDDLDAPESIYQYFRPDGARSPLKVARFGVNPSRRKLRHDVITGIISLLRTRYELAEKVLYHHAKCTADAMLDRLCRSAFAGGKILSLDAVTWGDDRFLQEIEQRLAEPKSPARRLLQDLRRRWLYKEVFRIPGHAMLSPKAEAEVAKASEPIGRSEIEQQLRTTIGDLDDCDMIVTSRPRNMQMKQAGALIRWVDGTCKTLSEIAKRYDYAREVSGLTDRYPTLWSFSVYVNPRQAALFPSIVNACEEHFDMANDPALQKSLDVDDEPSWKFHREQLQLAAAATREGARLVAAENGKRPPAPEVMQRVLDKLDEKADEKKDRKDEQARKPPKRAELDGHEKDVKGEKKSG